MLAAPTPTRLSCVTAVTMIAIAANLKELGHGE